tara:strand:- start:68 stop:316 length:249 start_codon:yes stop_codon:yes gene_type:complete
MLRRVSSATMSKFGAYESKPKRLSRVRKNKPGSLSPYKRKSRKKSKNSLPTNLERKMPGPEKYDGFSMEKRGGRKTRRKKRC